MTIANQYKKRDEELFKEVQKIKNGDDSSCQRVYELSEKYIYKIINDIVKNHHTTEDLMQEAYIQIYNKINTLQEVKAFYVWAGRIATNLTLRYLQKNAKEVLATPDEEGETDFIFEKASQDNEKFIPESVLVDRKKQRLIAEIIDQLSAEQKICIQYFYYEEMSVNEIAQAMGCSTGTIKSRLNYARKSIKEAVVELDEKHGTRLYSLASAPLFLVVFRAAAEGLLPTAAAGMAGSAATAGGASSVSTAGSTVATSATATTAGTASAGTLLSTKIAVVVGSVMLVGGGGATAVNVSQIVSAPQQVESNVMEEVQVQETEETQEPIEVIDLGNSIIVTMPNVETAPVYVPYVEPVYNEPVYTPTEEEAYYEAEYEEVIDQWPAYVVMTYSDGSTVTFEVDGLCNYVEGKAVIFERGNGEPVSGIIYNAAGQAIGTQHIDLDGDDTFSGGFTW